MKKKDLDKKMSNMGKRVNARLSKLEKRLDQFSKESPPTVVNDAVVAENPFHTNTDSGGGYDPYNHMIINKDTKEMIVFVWGPTY